MSESDEATTMAERMRRLESVAAMAMTPYRDSYDQYHDWHQRLRNAAVAALAHAAPGEQPAPATGGSEATTPNGRTTADAIRETEHLLSETFDKLDPDNGRDGWFMVRITKISEALADRPALARPDAPAGEPLAAIDKGSDVAPVSITRHQTTGTSTPVGEAGGSPAPAPATPAEEEHDPLCSEGQPAGDQTMPCDCHLSRSPAPTTPAHLSAYATAVDVRVTDSDGQTVATIVGPRMREYADRFIECVGLATIPAPPKPGAPCPQCGGTGAIKTLPGVIRECGICDGSGLAPPKPGDATAGTLADLRFTVSPFGNKVRELLGMGEVTDDAKIIGKLAAMVAPPAATGTLAVEVEKLRRPRMKRTNNDYNAALDDVLALAARLAAEGQDKQTTETK